MAAENYRRLTDIKRRKLTFSGITITLQHNPERVRSTAADTTAGAIAKRPCFLCRSNRPEEQQVLQTLDDDWEILLNPFPIFPIHYTIAHSRHQHQDNLDPRHMVHFVDTYPTLTAFYNASASGASAPDHLHFQAMPTTMLPLLSQLEQNPGKLLATQTGNRFHIADWLPAPALHITASDYSALQTRWLNTLLPTDPDTLLPDRSRRNIFFWRDAESTLHTLLFPRSKHRPECYYATDATHRLVSPGAIDMAAMLILPRLEDFQTITAPQAARILAEVSIDPISLPRLRNLLLQ